MATRRQLSVGKALVSVFEQTPTHFTLSYKQLKKIMRENLERLVCKQKYYIEHDGNGQYDEGPSYESSQNMLRIVDRISSWQKKPWLCYLNPIDEIITFCPIPNKSYEITFRGCEQMIGRT